MFSRLAAVTLLALAACAPRQETPEPMAARMNAESDSAMTAIQMARSRSERYVAAAQADSAAMIYAEDAVFSSGSGPAINGRAAIRTLFAGLLSWGSWDVSTTTTHVDANGPLAVEQGTYIQNVRPGPHAPAGIAAMFPDTGKYLAEWKRVNGSWLILAEFGNSSRTPPGPAATKH